MAIGDQSDQVARLARLLPPWFGDEHPVLNALLNGIGAAAAFLYSLIEFTKAQTRIRTATGGWLDLTAADFFGPSFRRGGTQSDTSLRARILLGLFKERATRSALDVALTQTTGARPTIFEPANPADIGGGYGSSTLGYGANGRYGSLSHPFQVLVDVTAPNGASTASIYQAANSVRPAASSTFIRLNS